MLMSLQGYPVKIPNLCFFKQQVEQCFIGAMVNQQRAT